MEGENSETLVGGVVVHQHLLFVLLESDVNVETSFDGGVCFLADYCVVNGVVAILGGLDCEIVVDFLCFLDEKGGLVCFVVVN